MLRLIVIAALILFGSACSRIEFAYRNAGSLLQYYAWKTVRTSATQRDQWQPVLEATLDTITNKNKNKNKNCLL